ncbi:uncharacterized protein LOC111102074 isoform X3 [Crassostrea virginica]
MPPRRPKRMKMSASKDSEQPVEPGQTPTPRSSEEAHGSEDDSPPGSTTDTLAVPTHASIPPVVPSVHSMIAIFWRKARRYGCRIHNEHSNDKA